MSQVIDPIDKKLAAINARRAVARGERIDLTDRTNWQTRTDEAGRLIENTVFSVCSRFTIVRYPATGGQPTSYSAFRRHGTPNETNWSPPQVISNHPDADAARAACAAYVEPEAQR
jgi:hypothetical protein